MVKETSIFITNNKNMVTLLKTIEYFEIFYNDQIFKLIKETNHDSFSDINISVYYENGEEVMDGFERDEVITHFYRDWETDRKSTRLNSSHITRSRMPSSA